MVVQGGSESRVLMFKIIPTMTRWFASFNELPKINEECRMFPCRTNGNWGAENDINNGKHTSSTSTVQGALPNVLNFLTSLLLAPIL